ncbi:hypothetical protein GGI11_008976, partial [Coemansia sp. RSA 2049]
PAVPSLTRKSSTESNSAGNMAVGPQPQSKSSSVPSVSEINGVKDLEISSPNDVRGATGVEKKPMDEAIAASSSALATAESAEQGSETKAEVASPSSGAIASNNEEEDTALAETLISAGGGGGGDVVAAVVPSKRPLAMVSATGDADVSVSDPSGEVQPSLSDEDSGKGKLPSTAKGEDGNDFTADDSNGNSGDANGDRDAGSRKRGRQESPSQAADKRLSVEPVPGSELKDEMEEGEEPEDGEVFEDEEGSQKDSKARKSEDVVMDSGKV